MKLLLFVAVLAVLAVLGVVVIAILAGNRRRDDPSAEAKPPKKY